ncbi:uncharacterized protein F5Z01DRAFT_433774 [Emericellopsis atlantica]|uniref:Uncharacterized protein n=1 Tax=Emericellopsis atlantica TaxID=2614577 RepID=A0A9P7ZD95_9HYPO|nr:uncharacterized protein F5Z01DRAFT_433774 [Emericellopsis atlantica]KAG9249979.1 hypothetical protein F5Z01DRAFT_433774 [Emericellopsis atlantica]
MTRPARSSTSHRHMVALCLHPLVFVKNTQQSSERLSRLRQSSACRSSCLFTGRRTTTYQRDTSVASTIDPDAQSDSNLGKLSFHTLTRSRTEAPASKAKYLMNSSTSGSVGSLGTRTYVCRFPLANGPMLARAVGSTSRPVAHEKVPATRPHPPVVPPGTVPRPIVSTVGK